MVDLQMEASASAHKSLQNIFQFPSILVQLGTYLDGIWEAGAICDKYYSGRILNTGMFSLCWQIFARYNILYKIITLWQKWQNTKYSIGIISLCWQTFPSQGKQSQSHRSGWANFLLLLSDKKRLAEKNDFNKTIKGITIDHLSPFMERFRPCKSAL